MGYKVSVKSGRRLAQIEDLDEALKAGCEEAAKCGTSIYVYGRHGCGKSSVLEYFEFRSHELFGVDESEVLFMTDFDFIETVISGIRKGGIDDFRKRCDDAKLIIIDDIDRFEGKEATLSEFRRVLELDKLIILSGSKEADYLPLSNEIRHKVISYTQMRIDEVSDDSSNLDVAYEECKDFTNSDQSKTYDYEPLMKGYYGQSE